MSSASYLGLSGRIAKQFQNNAITPLLAIVGLLIGLFAIVVTPREEEPQINVTFANVFIPFPGASAAEVESLVSRPAEQVLAEVSGLKHIYSVSSPGMSTLTVQFKVGEDRTEALVRLYNKLQSNQDWLPQNLGVMQPLVKPKGIDDVPIVAATLWSKDTSMGAQELLQVAHALEAELKRVPGTRDVYTIGGPDKTLSVLLDPQRMAGHQITLTDLRQALQSANASGDAVSVTANNAVIQIQTGAFLSSAEDVSSLVVGVAGGKPVYLRDVATVTLGADQPERYVAFSKPGVVENSAAVTLVVAKKPGENAVDIATAVVNRFEQLRGLYLPDNVEVEITRNYGETADAKAKKLIQKLLFATASVVVLVWLTMGFREAVIVGLAIIITLMMTLFASWAWGFTLNRVSLFALIFSIGILVDDAIVVVENIHRHMLLGGKNLLQAIPEAVDEVGGPTILATFTVIAALLPMAFVSGLMGPYMSPIPINASMGMLISLAVAYVVTPWLTYKLLKNVDFSKHHQPQGEGKVHRFFDKAMRPMLCSPLKRWGMLGTILLLIALSCSLAVAKIVVLKMLPFDNKSEFQIIVDMPEGTSLETTKRVLDDVARYVQRVPEVKDVQLYAGTAAPINFNGLVRQYYLREGANMGDVQVNLVDKHHRDRQSHEIALSLRKPLHEIGLPYAANIKVVEVPPGPPVLSPIVAEVYGLDYQGQIDVAQTLKARLAEVPDIIDIDDSVETPSLRYVLQVDRQKAALMGISQQQVTQAVNAVLGGEDVTHLHGDHIKYAVPVRLAFSTADKADIESVLALKIRSAKGQMVSLSEIVSIEEHSRQYAIHHKDLLPVTYVQADMVGELDSPLYGMFEAVAGMSDTPLRAAGAEVEQYFFDQPDNPYQYSIKWDGEWQITFETFRDMGIAYSVGLILIYLLVVAQFRSYVVPLVIMAPIPLTIIGVMPGHALLGAPFTATSMIGMIALAGIIVRNSILLVDFINEQVRGGMELQQAVISAGAVRAKPIILTGVAAMMGAFFILDDPIFSGLAISLIFGLLVSTLLTLIVIPIVYYAYVRDRVDSVILQHA